MRKFFNTYIAPLFVFALIHVISRTLKIHEVGKEIEDRLVKEGGPIIYVFWHGRLFFCPRYYSVRGPRPVSDYRILVSPSVDGEIIARTLSLFGYDVVRGSSYKSARRSLLELKRALDEGYPTVLIADGSRGPIYQMQPGSLMLSKLTGRPVLPFTMSFSSYWTLKSWDRMMIPKPFSKAVIVYGDPARLLADCDARTLEEERKKLEANLRSITGLADGYFSK